ncbi:MAG: hypothetical protein WDM96_19565 [Lacunisphaera sp.]
MGGLIFGAMGDRYGRARILTITVRHLLGVHRSRRVLDELL